MPCCGSRPRRSAARTSTSSSGEYPVAKGLTIGHEPVGIIEKLGSAVTGYRGRPAGDRRRDHAERPQQCLSLRPAFAGRCRARTASGRWAAGASATPSTAARPSIVLVPDAMANLAPVPEGLTDEQVLMCPDIMSTGFAGAESGGVKIGDTVAVFAQGPIGLCATAGARLMGATHDHRRRHRARAAEHGAARWASIIVVDFKAGDPVEAIMRLTDGRGVDVAIEALGTQATFEVRCASCDRAARCRASASTRAICGYLSARSPPDLATIGLSPRSARAARSACVA